MWWLLGSLTFGLFIASVRMYYFDRTTLVKSLHLSTPSELQKFIIYGLDKTSNIKSWINTRSSNIIIPDQTGKITFQSSAFERELQYK